MPDFPNEGSGPAKAALRVRMLARRRALSPQVRRVAAERIQAELIALVRRVRPARITGYVPVGSEPGGPDLPDALAGALGSGGQFLLPVLCPDLDLDWAPYGGPGSLVAAGRGLREPTGGRLGPAAVSTAGLIVVPAVAVDHTGLRLGRGGGSYDRALARTDGNALTVALLYDDEVIDAVPRGIHDRPVRAVITPSGGFQMLIPD